MDWLLGLWKKNKLLFWLLIIPVVLAFLFKIYQEIVFNNAKKSLKKTEDKSDALKAKVVKQENEAKAELDKAKEAGNRIKDRNENKNTNVDWHKKK